MRIWGDLEHARVPRAPGKGSRETEQEGLTGWEKKAVGLLALGKARVIGDV